MADETWGLLEIYGSIVFFFFFLNGCIDFSSPLLCLIVVGEIVFLRHSVATSGLYKAVRHWIKDAGALACKAAVCVTVYSLTALALSIKPSTSRPSDGINDSKSD